MTRLHYWLILFCLTFQVNVFAQESVSNLKASSDTLVEECGVYSIILSGVETKIKNYFRVVTLEELNNQCCENIVKAFVRLSPKDKVTHTLWILEEIKARQLDIRAKVYSCLLDVDYPKPNFFIKTMVNNYFTNYKEPDDSLAKQVSRLHVGMIR